MDRRGQIRVTKEGDCRDRSVNQAATAILLRMDYAKQRYHITYS